MSEYDPHERVKKLRDELKEAKIKVIEQGNTIKQLTSPPFIHATVISIQSIKTPQLSKQERLEKSGTRVRIHPDSPYRGQTENEGTVVGPAKEHGWVNVVFDDGSVNSYRTGRKDVEGGIRDLESIEPSEEFATATIAVENKFFEVLLPKKLAVKPGNRIAVSPQSMQIIGVLEAETGGETAYFVKMIDEELMEVEYRSSSRIIFKGSSEEPFEKGDQLLLDTSGMIVIRNLGKENERFRFTAETNVSWDDIGGLQKAKEQMIEAVELPHKHPDLFRFYGKRAKKGVLLYGPPGCGKTMLGKATATALAKIYNGNNSSNGFLYVKGPEILDRYVGVAEATIRQIFERGRKHKETSGYPAVIFIDEADAILGKRGSGISSDVERTIVPMFLTEWDGLEDSGALIILATNRADILDPAVTRDGRVDIKIYVGRPDYESVREIFFLNLKSLPIAKEYSYQDLAAIATDKIFSPDYILYHIHTAQKGTLAFTLKHIINGAMIVNTVEQATSIALHRDLSEHNLLEGRYQGLQKGDILEAVNRVYEQNRNLNHTDDLSEFTYDFREDIIRIHKLRQTTD